jgi:hypothetical protein
MVGIKKPDKYNITVGLHYLDAAPPPGRKSDVSPTFILCLILVLRIRSKFFHPGSYIKRGVQNKLTGTGTLFLHYQVIIAVYVLKLHTGTQVHKIFNFTTQN